jgi:hypothetical protein
MMFDMKGEDLVFDGFHWKDVTDVPPLPDDWPDHYSANDRPIKGAKSGLNLMDFITLPPPKVKLVRRRV